jgi:hypothetical protein
MTMEPDKEYKVEIREYGSGDKPWRWWINEYTGGGMWMTVSSGEAVDYLDACVDAKDKMDTLKAQPQGVIA